MTIPELKISVDYWDKKDTFSSKSGDKYYNVDAHIINYKPLTLKEIENKI